MTIHFVLSELLVHVYWAAPPFTRRPTNMSLCDVQGPGGVDVDLSAVVSRHVAAERILCSARGRSHSTTSSHNHCNCCYSEILIPPRDWSASSGEKVIRDNYCKSFWCFNYAPASLNCRLYVYSSASLICVCCVSCGFIYEVIRESFKDTGRTHGTTQDPLFTRTTKDPLCTRTTKDLLCTRTTKDPLCIRTTQDPLCTRTTKDPLCTRTTEDPLCIRTNKDPLCTRTLKLYTLNDIILCM